jgi:hypothetical protein
MAPPSSSGSGKLPARITRSLGEVSGQSSLGEGTEKRWEEMMEVFENSLRNTTDNLTTQLNQNNVQIGEKLAKLTDEFNGSLKVMENQFNDRLSGLDSLAKDLSVGVSGLQDELQNSQTRNGTKVVSPEKEKLNKDLNTDVFDKEHYERQESNQVIEGPDKSENYARNDSKSGKIKPGNSSRMREQRVTKSKSKTNHKTYGKQRDDDDPDSTDSSTSSEGDGRSNKKYSSMKKKIKKPQKHNSSESDNDNSGNSSDTDDEYYELDDIKVKCRSLRKALSIRPYRLERKSQTYNGRISGQISSLIKRIGHSIPEDKKFDGTDSVSVIRFLQEFRDACDHNRVTEGCALRLVIYFLKDSAKAGLTAHLASVKRTRKYSYPGVILYLLKAFAPESLVEREIRDIATLRQKSGESERAFGLRVQTQALRLGDAMKEYERIRAFKNGLPQSIFTYLDSATPHAETFDEVVRAAAGPGYVVNNLITPGSSEWQITGPSNETKTTDVKGQRRPNCFVCGNPHLVHECPSLSEDQRKSAAQVNQKYLAQKRENGSAQFYKGAGFTRDQPSYLLEQEQSDLEADDKEIGNKPEDELDSKNE